MCVYMGVCCFSWIDVDVEGVIKNRFLYHKKYNCSFVLLLTFCRICIK